MAANTPHGQGQSSANETNNCPAVGNEEADDIVQVIYQSNNSGSLVGVESSLISASFPTEIIATNTNTIYNSSYQPYTNNNSTYNMGTLDSSHTGEQSSFIDELDQPPSSISPNQPITRAASTLPSVAEESGSGGAGASAGQNHSNEEASIVTDSRQCLEQERGSRSISPPANKDFVSDDLNRQTEATDILGDPCCIDPHCVDLLGLNEISTDFCMNPHAIYSTMNKQPKGVLSGASATIAPSPDYRTENHSSDGPYTTNTYSSNTDENNQSIKNHPATTQVAESVNNNAQQDEQQDDYENRQTDEEKKDIEEINAEICQIISRQKQGAAESGSLRNNFKKKKLVVSSSTNENDLTAHRQKLLESRDANNPGDTNLGVANNDQEETIANLPSKFKRTHSVSFNVGSSRNSRHSVDIRNLPSYLTVKRASIVDVAKGAMSSLMNSFGSGTANSSISNSRRDSREIIDEEPIFEEPIAPTLSLGQRVALVKNNGAEFGTVGWIGQLPDVDDDWVVGVIFDNMIGNCDGAYNGIRYFYSRENFAMFVPLSVLTKTDNYIGRPETGTMLSRMSVSLKPGQLISIQRSSLRLQHCFLNAPHQRVGHDVRAVSNRLHCQCHNCGPCAHLTKQHSRVNALPAFGAHHAVNKKNSLAHAAVEILAHHHHHYHEEEHHEEEDYQFGDNAAHACNFVRYSCCQQNGGNGHEFSSDCGLVRPELLDQLIHAPKAPHSRTGRLRRMRRAQQVPICGPQQQQQQISGIATESNTLESFATNKLEQIEDSNEQNDAGSGKDDDDEDEDDSQSYSSCSSCSSSKNQNQDNTNSYQINSMNYFEGSAIYNTLESKLSLHDQQRFIYQRESNTSVHSRRDYLDDDIHGGDSSVVGFIPRLRRCFGCLKQRADGRRKRPKKRKLSARNRLIEYRRKQSTFVPSTLAKPQDDFASHGIVLPTWDPNNNNNNSNISNMQDINCNSDYSSYSKSSGSNSPNNSPRHVGQDLNYAPEQEQHQQIISIDHNVQAPGEQLKSVNQGQLNYGDYTYDNNGYGTYDKFAHSQDSDLGYFDLMTNSSGGTLKNIVDHAIEREESLQQLAPMDLTNISPIQSDSISHSCCDLIEVSSPTISMLEQEGPNELSERLEGLDIDKEPTNIGHDSLHHE